MSWTGLLQNLRGNSSRNQRGRRAPRLRGSLNCRTLKMLVLLVVRYTVLKDEIPDSVSFFFLLKLRNGVLLYIILVADNYNIVWYN